MKQTMYDYIKAEQCTNRRILENRKESLRAFAETLKKRSGLSKLMFFATGSSVNAVNCVKYYLEELTGLEVVIKIPFLFAGYEKVSDSDALAIAVSQGGSSYSTIEAVQKAKALGFKDTFAVTAKADSPITRHADHFVDIGCGEEKVGFVTMGFSATVLTLMLMAVEGAYALGRIDGEGYDREIEKIAEAIEKINDVIERTNLWYSRNREELAGAGRLITIAYGPNYGAALEGYTKLTETVRCPVNGFELEEYLHGPNLELNSSHYIFFVRSKGMVEERLVTLRDFMGTITEHCFVISHEEDSGDPRVLPLGFDGDENISPLLFVIPFQVLAYRLSGDKGISLESDLFKDFSKALNIKVAQ